MTLLLSVMKLISLLPLLFLSMSIQRVIAFPRLLPRGGDEIPWGQWAQGAGDLITGTGDWITGAAAAGMGALGSVLKPFFDSPQSTDTATTQDAFTAPKDSSDTLQNFRLLDPLNDSPPNPTLDPPPIPQADINLLVTGEVDQNDPCYPSNLNRPECDGRPLDRVILTSICENLASKQIQITEAIKSQNLFIERSLTGMDAFNKRNGYLGGSGVQKSQCRSYDVLYFRVPLTDKQVDDINRLEGVYTVEFSQKVTNDNYHESDTDLQENLQPSIKVGGRGLEQSSATEPPIFNPSINIQTQSNVYPDLGFISTPFGKKTARAYDYDSKAGEGVVAWVINSGAERHPDFAIDEYHFAQGVPEQEADDLGFGTCQCSKIVGRYGVAKNGRLRVMKISQWLESIIDGLGRITDSVIDMPEKGFVVIALDQDWIPLGGKSTRVIEDLITRLERDHGVPFVVKSGDDKDVKINSQQQDLELGVIALPALWSETHPLIVAGAVNPIDGKKYPWSRGGSLMTISAPGKVMCSNHFKPDSPRTTEGGRFAAAQVTGLLTYLLSTAQYGEKLRRDPIGVPGAIKKLILELGYAREGSKDIATWNGLDSTLKQFWR